MASQWQEQKKYLTGYKKFMNEEEIKKLLNYMGIMTEQMRMIFLIMIFTGMRVSEVVSLKKDCIMGDKITFRQAKNKRLHTRILNTRIKDLLYEYFKKFEDKFIDGYIFPPLNNNSKNTHIQTASVRWAMKKFRDSYKLNDIYYIRRNKMQLNRISVHTIRHYFLTKFYSLSNDILLTAEVIGHKKIEQTVEYIKAWKRLEREKEIVEKMEIC